MKTMISRHKKRNSVGQKDTMSFYQSSYKKSGFNAQRLFPNEELCRFMGRNYFARNPLERKQLNVLEVGCGSGANLWMLAFEGFNTFGLDISQEATNLCHQMLFKYGCKAKIDTASMTDMPYENDSMDVIIDVFSSNCISLNAGKDFIKEVHRVLKPNGCFFSYFPSKNSDAWIKANAEDILDQDTLTGINRPESPFFGNNYPFRFLLPDEYEDILTQAGLATRYNETVARTYRNRQEFFEFLVIEAVKID